MESYWTVKEVAAALQISVQTVYRYVANGEIPFHKLTRAVRFKPSEIEIWMDSRTAGVSAVQNEDGGNGLFSETEAGKTEIQVKTETAENDGGVASFGGAHDGFSKH
jgi:excisionase family DNA binding protein